MNILGTNIQIILFDAGRDVGVRIDLAEHPGSSGQDSIRAVMASELVRANDRKARALSVLVFNSGAADFPHIGAAKIVIQEILKFLRMNKNSTLKDITLCLSDQEAFETFDKTIRGYVNHLQNDLAWGPYVTVDIIIELPQGIVLIERSNPPYGWALPGGFVDYGESLEHAAVREAKEETNLNLIHLRQFHTYSDPGRDPRFQTISTVFIAEGHGHPKSGDDAKGLTIIPRDQLLSRTYAFDHGQIIKDYLGTKKSG